MDTYTVEFRIEGRGLDPQLVTTDLGLVPSQVRESRKNKANEAERWWIWCYEGAVPSVEWGTLEEGLISLLVDIRPRQEVVRTYQQQCDVYWWCGHFQSSFNGGPTFSAALFRELAQVGVPLVLRTYRSENR